MDSEENKNEESQSDPPPSNSNPPQPESISNSNPVDDSDSSIPMNEILLNLVLSSFENNIFLSENTLSSLENILYPKITPLDDFCLNDPEIDSKLSIIIKERSLAIVDFLKDKMQFCHSKIIDGEFSHLEKLMKILRSSKREMRLTRLKEPENSQLNFQKNLPQSNLESIFAKIRHCAHNKTIDRKRSQSLILENDYEINERSKSCDKFNNEEPSWCMHVLIKNKRREKMECLTKELLSINDLQELITFNIFKKNLIKENSPSDNSFSFRLNNRYLVTLKNCEERTTDKVKNK